MALRITGSSTFRVAAIALSVGLLPEIASAHVGVGPTSGLLAGLAHPLGGIDHICAMVAVGLWGAQRGGRSVWLLPLAFVGVMTLGGILGAVGIALPLVEKGIIASLLVFGVLVAGAIRLPLVASASIVGLFALFHGHAHGAEMPSTAAGLTFGVGFVTSTALLHASGIVLAMGLKRAGRAELVRLAGAAIAVCGVALLT